MSTWLTEVLDVAHLRNKLSASNAFWLLLASAADRFFFVSTASSELSPCGTSNMKERERECGLALMCISIRTRYRVMLESLKLW